MYNDVVRPDALLDSATDIRTTRPLSAEQIAQYHRDGYLIVRGLFDPEEVRPIGKACDEDPNIHRAQTVVDSRDGKNYKVATLTKLNGSLVGAIPRIARIVDGAEALLGMECYHWHSKLLRKQPGDGRVGIHQDFATWYEDGCLFPYLLTCSIAIDRNDRENGCLEIVPGSHLMARFHRVLLGDTIDTHGPDPVRVEKACAMHGITYCELNPGDVVFFHCNTLHRSQANRSDGPRTILHCSYNAVANQPIFVENQEHHRHQSLHKLPDDFISAKRYECVLAENTFNPRETEEDPGVGIFFRKSDGDVAKKSSR